MDLCLSYPMFWSIDAIGEFWQYLGEIVFSKCLETSVWRFISNKFNDIKHQEFVIPQNEHDWRKQIDFRIREYLEAVKLLHFLKEGKSIEEARDSSSLDGSLLGLLRAARNVKSHIRINNHKMLDQLDEVERDNLNNHSDYVSDVLSNRGVSFWIKEFPQFLPFTYSIANDLRYRGMGKHYTTDQLEFFAKYLPNGNILPSIPTNFDDYFIRIFGALRSELDWITEIYITSYKYRNRTITFLKFPKDGKFFLEKDLFVRLIAEVQGNCTLAVSVYRVHTQSPEEKILETQIPTKNNQVKQVVILLKPDINFAFQELLLLKDEPCTIFVTGNNTHSEIDKFFMRYKNESKYENEIKKARIEWTRFTEKAKIQFGKLELKLHERSPSLVTLREISTRKDICTNMSEALLTSLFNRERTNIFEDSLPQLPSYYVPHILNPSDADEDKWLTTIIKDVNPGRYVISGVAGSGKSSFLASIGRKLIGKNYLVRYVAFHRMFDELMQQKDLAREDIFRTIWSESEFHADLANKMARSKTMKIAVLLDGVDEISIQKYRNAANILKEMLETLKNILVVVCKRPSNEIDIDGSHFSLVKLIKPSQTRLIKRYWRFEANLEVDGQEFEKIAKQCVRKYQRYNVEWPMFCALIAAMYVDYVKTGADFVQYSIVEFYEMLVQNSLKKCIASNMLSCNEQPEKTQAYKINSKSFLFVHLKQMMDSTHQHHALREVMAASSLENIFPKSSLEIDQIYKFGLVEKDGRFIHATIGEFYQARFAHECMSSSDFNRVHLNILRKIFISTEDELDFQRIETMKFLNEMLKSISIDFVSNFLEEDILYVQSFIVNTINGGLIDLLTSFLNAVDEAGKLQNILDQNDNQKSLVKNKITKDICQNWFLPSIDEGHVSVVKYFVEFSLVDKNKVEKGVEDTPMHKAVRIADINKCEVIVKYLLKNNFDVSKVNRLNLTPLDYAEKLKAEPNRRIAVEYWITEMKQIAKSIVDSQGSSVD